MLKSAAFFLAAMLALPVQIARADEKPNYDRLQQMLEQKFAPKPDRPTTGNKPNAPAKQPKKEDFQWVDPDKDSKKRGSGSLSPTPSPARRLTNAPAADDFLSLFPSTASQAGGTRVAQSSPVNGGVVVAQAETPVPVAKRNSFVIQLNPAANEEQIATLLKKYDLKITKVIGALGVITVEANDPPSGARTARPAAESDLESVTDPAQKLDRILDPPLIKALRKEPIVDAAFVNSVIDSKALPKPGGAAARQGGKDYSWRWTPGVDADGNWGLKAIRMPAVWSVVERFRKQNPQAVRPKIGVIDVGFADNGGVTFKMARGALRPPLVKPDCESNHGTHVAGIIGASQKNGPGIDGIVPDAKIDAIAIGADFIRERDRLGANQSWQQQAMLFSDVLANTMFYLTDNLKSGEPLRVVNISLAYNFVARGVLGDADPDSVNGLKLHIAEQATVIRTMARLVEDEVLFVVAAGNDSEGRSEPLDTRWASPFAWAGTYEWTSGEPVKNILVVEAVDRDLKRASFSNVGGHVAAPGVDIMSTLAKGEASFSVCSGTSQAAPHVSALAGILFELEPSRTPAEVIDIIESTATPPADGAKGAGTLDALEAVLRGADAAATLLADLDGNGKVDAGDMKIFAKQLASIETSAMTEAPFTEDLNGDGVVDDNECFWPQIDLNGNGQGAIRTLGKSVRPEPRSDLDALEFAWQGSDEELTVALAETKLGERLDATFVAAADIPTEAPTKCRRKDAMLIAAAMANDQTSTPTGSTTDASANVGTTTAQTENTNGSSPPIPGSPSTDATSTNTTGNKPTQRDEEFRAGIAKAIVDLKRDNPDVKITINPATGLPSSITGLKPDSDALAASATRSGKLSDDDTRRIVEGFLNTGGLTAALATRNKQAQMQYVGRRPDPDFPERYIANVEQRINGVPVFGSTAKLVVESSLGVTRYQGTTSAVAVSDTVPKVTEAEATSAARERLKQLMRGSATSPAPPLQMGPNPELVPASAELVVFDPALQRANVEGGARLAWLVSIDIYRIFVDAGTREVFHYFRDRPSAMVRRIYDLGQTTSGGKVVVDEGVRPNSALLTEDAEQAFRYTGAVRDFFFLMLGRESYDDNDGDGPLGGSPLESYVRHGATRNAFWCSRQSYDCPKGNAMVFGPGYAGAVDIVAHEMTHGIIAYESKLVYADEPGAVNESIADIFGALIEFYAKGEEGNWLIGEDAPGFSVDQPLRSLANPNLSDAAQNSLFNRQAPFSSANRGQPDHYADKLTEADPLCGSTWLADNGCVHFNSGILNKFAYLVAEGGTHRGITVTGIGRAKLARLTYRTVTANLNSSSSLLDAADGFLQSCLDLTAGGKAGFTEADCQSVSAARQAVGLAVGS